MPKFAPAEVRPPLRGMPPKTDLRSITRDSERCLTTVILHADWETRVTWLEFGQASLHRQKESRHDGRWRLEAYLTEGVTDFEHDSAYALKLPLIGLQLNDLAVHYHSTHLVAWVDPEDSDNFRVPDPGYNPAKHKDAYVCKDKRCLDERKKGHIIIPEGFYVPPVNQELYKLVRGKRVEIRIGPTFKEKE